MSSPQIRTPRFFSASTLVAATVLRAPALLAQTHVMVLDHGWEFRQASPGHSASTETQRDPGQWRPAAVHGDIHLDLIRETVIPDPFWRTNEVRLQWISKADWEYSTRLEADLVTVSQEHIELVFENLDSYATITLNGPAILIANNMFRTWRVDIKPFFGLGKNQHSITFPSPKPNALRIAEEDPWNARTHTEVKTNARKAASEFGWDWGPNLMTSGILREARTGLISVVLRRDQDKWDRSFELVVIGIPIFAKGADIVPFDSFPNRVTSDRYRHFLEAACDSNMNMVHVWGGGYDETQTFYDMCDELGLMIWHNFMLGNNWQPGTYKLKQNIEKEAEDQVIRLRNHPSIVLWCGNNETEEALNWKGSDKLEDLTRFHMWGNSLPTFHGILVRAVARLQPELPYWPSLPSPDLEQQSATNKSGDDHIRDVWQGRVPFSTCATHHARFVSEYGFQSFPQLRTVDSYTVPQDRTSILSPMMLSAYAAPKDFASFLYISQVLQAEGDKIGAEHFRRERPITRGSLFGQLNEYRHVASWSSLDSLGRWEALQFYGRRFYAPLLVSPHVKNGDLAVNAISDRTAVRNTTMDLTVHRIDGTVVMTKTLQVSLPPLSSTVIYGVPMTGLPKIGGKNLANLYVTTKLTVPQEQPPTNFICLVPTAKANLPRATLQMQVNETTARADLVLRSDTLTCSIYLEAETDAAIFSDNFFDLEGNQSRTIHITGVSAEDST